MTVKLAAFGMFLAATSVWAQSPAPATAPVDKSVIANHADSNNRLKASPLQNRRASLQTQLTPHQRVQEMESTLNSMHALLKKMRTKTVSSSRKDLIAEANVEMWELMLVHLDKQFDQLRIATLTREDLEARRAALYKQAFNKAATAAQSAAGATANQTAPAPSTSVPPSPKK
jgi:Skp family chaperone for outer membrane proteins